MTCKISETAKERGGAHGFFYNLHISVNELKLKLCDLGKALYHHQQCIN